MYKEHEHSLHLKITHNVSTGLGMGQQQVKCNTEWLVGCSTEMVDSSPSTESMDSWAAAPWTESVDFSLS